MRHALDLFSWQGRVSRRGYVLAGLLLFLLKYPIDHIVSRIYHQPWNPLMYLSPRVSPLNRWDAPQAYLLALGAVAVPFVYMGLSLTVRRLRDVGVSPFWAGLFFLPFVHFAFFAILAFTPSQASEAQPPTPDAGPYRDRAGGPLAAPPPRFLTRAIPQSLPLAFLLGLLLSLLMGLTCYVLAVHVHSALGGGLFIGLPFGMGFFTAFTTSYGRPNVKARTAIWYGTSPVLVSSLVMIAVAFEGIACIVMAFPILWVMTGLGAWVGWLVARSSHTQVLVPVLLLFVPALVGMDVVRPPRPEPMSVVSTVTIHAPPEVVWRNVVSFPPIDSPPAAIFAIVSMPLEARIDGQDPGATRRCVFTNGTFVEPIEVWNAPRELTFGVKEQPGNLDNYIDVSRGQFLLTDNHDGTTTLRGTTWYDLKVFPVAYWRMWTETFLHAIHLRVLDHVKQLSEEPDRPRAHAAALPAWMEASHATCACTRHPSH
jgi:uncharacterized membrane protein YhaH (DUF805 family)